MKTLRIIELKVENVKRLKAVRIKPDATLVKIEGKNAAGKSSVLDAIAAVLGGGKRQPEMPIRKGAKRASAMLDFGDELQAERKWSATGGTTLEVTSKGNKLGSPQAVLDKLIGDCTYDPLAFIRAHPKDQARVLKNLAGLDWEGMDAERAEAFRMRTHVNREAKAAKARAGEYAPKPSDMERVDLGELGKRQQEVTQHNHSIEREKVLIEGHRRDLSALGERITDARADLEEKEKEFEERLASILKREKGLCDKVEVGDLPEQIGAAQAHNAKIDDYLASKERFDLVDTLVADAEKLSDRIQAIDDEKAASLKAAEFPMPGLSIDEDGVQLEGIPLSQASSAEQLRVAVAIGLSENKQCRVILIKDGSLLDNAGMELLHGIAVEHDAQVFVERVADEASPSAVYIEDGEVVENETD